jgi:hypothetical protein
MRSLELRLVTSVDTGLQNLKCAFDHVFERKLQRHAPKVEVLLVSVNCKQPKRLTFEGSNRIGRRVSLLTAFALAPRYLCCESMQALSPKTAKLVEPGVHQLKRLGIHGIDTARPVDANCSESILTQDAQVLRHTRLRDAELPFNLLGYGAGRLLTCREDLKNTAPNGVAQDVEGVH